MIGARADPTACDDRGWSAIDPTAARGYADLAFSLSQSDPLRSVNSYLEGLCKAEEENAAGPAPAPPPSQRPGEVRRQSAEWRPTIHTIFKI